MWILGHLIQAIDNRKLAHQRTYLLFETPTTNFHHWIRHISADHTSVRSFSFQLYLIITQVYHGAFHFLTLSVSYTSSIYYCNCLHDTMSICVRTSYLLPLLCLIKNDYGSVTRDHREIQVNSVDFLEIFFPRNANGKRTRYRLGQEIGEGAEDHIVETDLSMSGKATTMPSRLMYKLVEGDAERTRLMQLLRVMTNVTDSWGKMVSRTNFYNGPAGQAIMCCSK